MVQHLLQISFTPVLHQNTINWDSSDLGNKYSCFKIHPFPVKVFCKMMNELQRKRMTICPAATPFNLLVYTQYRCSGKWSEGFSGFLPLAEPIRCSLGVLCPWKKWGGWNSSILDFLNTSLRESHGRHLVFSSPWNGGRNGAFAAAVISSEIGPFKDSFWGYSPSSL